MCEIRTFGELWILAGKRAYNRKVEIKPQNFAFWFQNFAFLKCVSFCRSAFLFQNFGGRCVYGDPYTPYYELIIRHWHSLAVGLANKTSVSVMVVCLLI